MQRVLNRIKFLFSVGLVFVLGMTASCVEQAESKKKGEPKDEIVELQEQPTIVNEVEEKVDMLPYGYAGTIEGDHVDTLWYKDFLFISKSIPDELKLRMQGKSMKDNARIGYDNLRYLTVFHYDFEGNIKQGELVCNQDIAHDLLCVFRDLFSEAYPIHSIRLVDDFDASDELSMQANNTSCFNYRTVPGTTSLSRHAFGRAIDINPLQNPYVRGSKVYPATATDYVDRTKDFPHKIDANDFCKKVFTSYGFIWGGDWRGSKDYQHFEKR